MSLPKNALYTNKLQSSYARNFMTSIQPQNGDANLGDTIIFNVPTGGNLVMSGADTVLKLSLTIRGNAAGHATGTVNLNKGGAYGCFQRLRIFCAGVMISDWDNYNNLLDMLITCQQSTDTLTGKYALLAGTGDSRGMNLGAFTANQELTFNYCIPFISLLSMSQQYVPLFALSGAPLRIELQVVSSMAQIARSTVALATPVNRLLLTGIELVCNMIELSDTGMAIVKNAIGNQPLQWVCRDYKNYSQNIVLQNSDTTVSIPIPAKFNSLDSLFFSFRSGASVGGATGFMANESTKFFMSEYFLRIGSRTIPAKSPNTSAEFFSELLRAFGSVSDVNHETNIIRLSYEKDRPAALTALDTPSTETYVGSFYVGLDLESYSNANISDGVYTGVNTSNDDIFFVPRFGSSNNANTSVRVDSYALYDQLILINNGQVSVNY
jgi:hypothetical protein